MKAISLHQPYASLIAIGAKKFETRHFRPPTRLIGQRIAIHSAKKPLTVAEKKDPEFKQAFIGSLDWTKELPFGAVVCTAVLSEAFRCGERDGHAVIVTESSKGGLLDGPCRRLIAPDPFGDYDPGRWAWLLEDVEPVFPTAPAKGMQGWFEWEPGW